MEKIQSRALRMAHILAKQEVPIGTRPRTWSENVKYAWWFIDFRNRLSQGFATFSFFKKDGSIREARGTLFMPLIPLDKWPKEKDPYTVHSTPYTTFPFFDLDKLEWRSFDIRNFIGFITYYRITGDK